MNVVVAGGTGFLGSTIVDALVDAGHEVIAASRSRPRPSRANPATQWRHADVTDPATLRAAVEGADVVVDAVQFPNMPIENPAKGYTFERIDLDGTRHLVDAARGANVPLFIGLSGVGAAPDARYHWLRFKWQEEEYIHASDLQFVIFRPSWIYGPGDVSLNRFLGFARFLPFVPVIGDGKTRINPLFIEDIGTHVAAAVARDDIRNAVFEIGGPETVTMDEVIRAALEASGKRRLLLHQPATLVKIAGGVASHLPGRPLTADAIDFITMDGVADTTALQAAFHLPRTPLAAGLRTYLS
jgi:NADH dehydrogenase